MSTTTTAEELSARERIELTIQMLRALSRQNEPNKAAFEFSSRFWRLRPSDYFLTLSTRGLPKGDFKITRSRSRVEAEDELRRGELRQNPWRDWNILPAHRGGFIGDVISQDVPRVFNNLRVRNDPVLGDLLAEMGSCIANPLYDGGEAINWALSFRRDPGGYSEEDIETTLLIGNLAGAATRNLVHANEVRRLNERLTAQFEEVARVQQSLLPGVHPAIPGVKIATSYLPSDLAGGDYYDFFEMPDGQWGFLIADASGHGVGAATVMAMLHAILHSYPDLARGPAAVMQWANAKLGAAKMEASFVTAVFATYDPATRKLSYARAGHPPPLVKDGRTGQVYPLEGAASLPLGIMDEYDGAEASVTLRPGDTVVLYTDGITEAFAPGKKEMFGVEGLTDAITRCSGDPDCVVDTVHTSLFEHTGLRTRVDDQTLVAMRVGS